jgi:hypothetical protein
MPSTVDNSRPGGAASLADGPRVIEQLYQFFNEQRFDDAAALFAAAAILEHAPVRRREIGPAGYLAFIHMWTRAFPDARVTVEDVQTLGRHRYEANLTASGTHLGALDLAGCGVFKPSGVRAHLRLRQLIEIDDQARIVFSSLSFDLQEVVNQLVSVDTDKLEHHLHRLRTLSEVLAATPRGAFVDRQRTVSRIGAELDAARRVVRPYYDR